MTNKEALKTLKRFQSWRLGEPTVITPETKGVSKALSVAISLLESELKYCQCKNPWINPKGGSYECMSCDKQIK